MSRWRQTTAQLSYTGDPATGPIVASYSGAADPNVQLLKFLQFRGLPYAGEVPRLSIIDES